MLGVPRRLVEDEIYESYVIPKESNVIANISQMLRGPSVYATARYLPQDGGEAAPDSRELTEVSLQFYAVI